MKVWGIIPAVIGTFHVTAEASFEKIGVGSRAIGMGSAFVAVANDASAIYWNAAGLALGRDDPSILRQFSLMYSPLYGLSYLKHKFACYTQNRLSDRVDFGALGFGIIELDLSPNAEDAQSLRYVENTFLLSWAHSFPLKPLLARLAIGASFKYYNLNATRSASGYGGDVGLVGMHSMNSENWKINLSIGCAVQDVGGSGIWYRGGASPSRKEIVEPNYRVGFAAGFERKRSVFNHLLLSADWHKRDQYSLQRTEINLGSELKLFSHFDLRFGIQDLNAPRYAFGMGILAIKSFIPGSVLAIDASVLTHPDLSSTLAFSLSLRAGKRS